MDDSTEITAKEAAKIIGVTSTHVGWYYRQGLLPGRRIGERLLVFLREDVEKFEKPKKTGRPKTARKEKATVPKKRRGKPKGSKT